MAITKLDANTPLVLVGQQTGLTIIPAQTPLTRLNYFDGKFLRAQDLQAEQEYLRQLTQLSNQANGFGLVNGFDLSLGGGDQLTLSPGLAIDPRGRVLLLGQEQRVSIAELIAKSRELFKLLQSSTLKSTGGFANCEVVSAAPTTAVAGRDWYLITISHAEALCGEEDVYGKLCEEACVTSTDRPYRIEGVVLRALPLLLGTPLAQSTAVKLDRTHLRSLIASAFYADEAKRVGDLISRAGLASTTWCNGAVGVGGNDVALGVLVRDGNSALFLDDWIARRELIETSPRRYWQWRMAMRPWDVYVAQILQFQCHLHHRFADAPPDAVADDPCAEAKELVGEAAKHFKALSAFYEQTTSRLQKVSKKVRESVLEEGAAPELFQNKAQLAAFDARLQKASEQLALLPQNRLLIRLGIVETPSAGYLPVIPGNTLSVNSQVRRLMGEGVDLRFCVVRPDFVPHALEEAQHMERISLLQGLDDPNNCPHVDVLVPNGTIARDRSETGRFYEMRLNLIPENLELLALATQLAAELRDKRTADGREAWTHYLAMLGRAEGKAPDTFEYNGAARAEAGTGGLQFYYAGVTKTGSVELPKAETAPAPLTAAEAAATGATIETTTRTLRSASVLPRTLAGMVRAEPALAERDVDRRSAVWLSLTMADDPAELARGRSTAVKAECFLLMTLQLPPQKTVGARELAAVTVRGLVTTLLRATFTGELSVDSVAARSDLVEVRGTLSGELTLSMRVAGLTGSATADSGDQGNFSLYLSEPVEVQRTTGPFGWAYKILGPNWSFLQPAVDDVEIERKWTAAEKAEALGLVEFVVPASIALRQAIAAKTVRRQMFRAWQSINANVREPQHPAHEDSIRALRSIAVALGSPKFADLGAQRLFPAPPPDTSALNVFATLDWVLFHRRREKKCELDKPVVPIATRTYALYRAQLDGDQRVADLRRLLERTAANAKLPALDFVQLVEFGAGIHAVLSPHSQVQASWRQDVGDDAGPLAGGLIASSGVAAGEGERLAAERLESLADVIEPLPQPGIARDFQVLARVPDALNAAGADGVVILATAARPQVKNTLLAVYFYGADHQQEFVQVLAAAQEDNADRFRGMLKIGTPVGLVEFKGATTEPADPRALDDLLQKWQGVSAVPPLRVEIIYPRRLDPTVPGGVPYEQGLRMLVDESVAITNKLGFGAGQA
ncbi:MAG TPA: hypothetical protein VE907_07045, partial [Gammaproteobacteria bacterium]|nr:hypothetical protein [Gammaproteobacteria bacterium]